MYQLDGCWLFPIWMSIRRNCSHSRQHLDITCCMGVESSQELGTATLSPKKMFIGFFLQLPSQDVWCHRCCLVLTALCSIRRLWKPRLAKKQVLQTIMIPPDSVLISPGCLQHACADGRANIACSRTQAKHIWMWGCCMQLNLCRRLAFQLPSVIKWRMQ